ncbi:MAG: 1L-myo-inositol 1-phosphate cytidylyltransferase / CDP-L-myo-inositol myo-inositolphosphotransferase [Sphingomonadales bacterium]|jgi:CDP-L-myo-inositol myo-inositolphosphotransferase|nr:1L-myo-inositol 1-phosphate cytidylyltransferase / CDP-L-myo-inositol myo-inositolphosphotransferase [Sphingomonadales bacterium]
MTFEKPGSAALSVRLAFCNADAAEASVAGVAAVAHAAHFAGRRGVREVWIDLRDSGLLSDSALEDVRRACPGVAVRLGAGEAAALHHPFPFRDAGEATRWLLRSTGKEGDGYISRRLNRPVSRAISAFLLIRFPEVRPNHATAATAIVALLMFASLMFGGWPGLIAGGILFHAASVLDGVDGEIARATYRSSPAGAVLDSAVDMATNLLFYLGITASLFRVYGRIQLEVGGWAVMAGLSGLVLLSWLVRQIGEPGNYDIIKRFYRARCSAGFPRFVVEMFVMITSRDFFAFGSMILILAGQPRMVTLGLALFATLWLSLILLALPSLLRNGSAAAPAPLALDAGPSLP